MDTSFVPTDPPALTHPHPRPPTLRCTGVAQPQAALGSVLTLYLNMATEMGHAHDKAANDVNTSLKSEHSCVLFYGSLLAAAIR